MAKLYFKYGTMNSSKTANLLMVAHNYESQGKKVLCFKPSIDTRGNLGMIETRAGLPGRQCYILSKLDTIEPILLRYDDIYCILIDEAQFLTKKQVRELGSIVDCFNIPVICFGLKNSYKDGELFEGSSALLYYADNIEEIRTVCQYCNSKASMNLRIVNDKAIYDGNVVSIGDVKTDNDYYIPVCRKHYYNPDI